MLRTAIVVRSTSCADLTPELFGSGVRRTDGARLLTTLEPTQLKNHEKLSLSP